MLWLSDTAVQDIYEANKTTAKDQETAVVGTRQQQTLGDKGSDESEAEDRLLHLPRFGKTNLGNRQLILVKQQWLFCKSN